MILSRCASRRATLFFLPFLVACSDLRATFEIKGSAHALSLIRVTGMFWEKTAQYSIVAARMPDCMRRHPMSKAALIAKVEVYSPGNDAWILKQGAQMYVTETRTCEGFAKLDAVPDSGLGALMGSFEMRNDVLVFVAAPKVVTPPPQAELESAATETVTTPEASAIESTQN